MSLSLKVLQKAIDNKDYNFLVRALVDKLLLEGWSQEDVGILAKKLSDYCR